MNNWLTLNTFKNQTTIKYVYEYALVLHEINYHFEGLQQKNNESFQ